ncbi:MAG: hypothetical protein ACKVWV_18800 [Planctomycetota bacterium]
MALDDFSATDRAASNTRSATSHEDEDLFDFPVVEGLVDLSEVAPQTAASTAVRAPQTASEDDDLFGFPAIEVTLESLERDAAKSSAQKPFLAAPTKQSAPTPAPVAAPSAPAVRAPAPEVAAPAAAHVAAQVAPGVATQHVAQAAPAVAAAAAEPIAPRPALAARPQAQPVARAAELIDDIETAMGADIESGVGRRRKRSLVAVPALWLVIGAGLALNAGAFLLLWQSNRSFRHGIEGLRDELVVTVREMRLGANETRAALPAALASEPVAHAPAQAPKLQSAPPIEPFEKTTLTLAEEEIRTGEFAAARRRLYRLLAMADRIDAGLRESIEMRASYMLADSYRLQALARRERAP